MANVTNSMVKQLVDVVAALGLALMAGPAAAAKPAVYSDDGKVAIKSADAVAYFTLAKATKGSPDYAHEWGGAKWHFVNAAHRDTFAANPEKYAPQFGGFCAVAAAAGRSVKVDPAAWSIWHGKLYLNYSKRVTERFERDPERYLERARTNWK